MFCGFNFAGFCCVAELMGMKSDSSTMDTGQKRLHELGYKQELKRDLSYVHSFLSLPPLVTSLHSSLELAAAVVVSDHSSLRSSPNIWVLEYNRRGSLVKGLMFFFLRSLKPLSSSCAIKTLSFQSLLSISRNFLL